MKSIQNKDIDLERKKILLRLDLNVPIENGQITDTNRIEKIIPTLKYLLEKKAKIIILSHVGRPKGKVNKDLSLKPICENLELKLKQKIKLIDKSLFDLKFEEISENFKSYEIIILENIRFYKEEEENDENFAKLISSFGNIYVNDAFSCSHRKHASVFSITKFLPSYSGLQMETEVNSLKKITENIEKPITCIIGGSKISTKINIIKNLIKKFDNIVIVGGMANNILKYHSHNIGKSINEKNCNDTISEIFSLSKTQNCKITYPIDVSVGKNMNDNSKIKNIDEISDDEIILDIGPKTIELIENIIENSKTILWNGPAGYFENPNFAKGSKKIANKIAERNKTGKIFSVAGGGDTVAAINTFKLTKDFNFISTAGGAFLEFLEGKELPGIKALN